MAFHENLINSEVEKFFSAYEISPLLQRLIRMDTQNPPGNERAVIDFILDFLENIQKEYPHHETQIQILDHGDNRASLIYKVAGRSREGLAFIGHVDTVPAEDLDNWEHSPLSGEIVGDMMYGRGTSDMKGGVTAMLACAEYLLMRREELPRDVYFIFTADEELGSIGIYAVADSGIWKDFSRVIVCEPTSNQLGIFEKGAICISVSALGKASHAAHPETGINAIEMLFEFYSRLRATMSRSYVSDFGDRSSICLTTISGGVKNNMVPDSASATLDIRTVNAAENCAVLDVLPKICEDMERTFGVKIQTEIVYDKIPLKTERIASIVRELEALYQALHYPFQTTKVCYYTDMAVLYQECPLPFVILGPGQMDCIHQANESIMLEKVKQAAVIYTLYALEYCGTV